MSIVFISTRITLSILIDRIDSKIEEFVHKYIVHIFRTLGI